MKRIIPIVVAIAMIVSLAACKGSEPAPSVEPSATVEPSPSASPVAPPTATASPSTAPVEPSDEPTDEPYVSNITLSTAMWSEELEHAVVELQYPEIVCRRSVDALKVAEANSEIKEEVFEFYREFVEELEEDSGMFGSWGAYVSYEQYLTREESVSFRLVFNEYNGGAHPRIETESYTWVDGLGFVDLHDLFGVSEEAFKQSLVAEIRAQIAEDGEGLYPDASELAGDLFDDDMCILDAHGVEVRYGEYLLGPYAAGPQIFIVPYEQVAGTVPQWING